MAPKAMFGELTGNQLTFECPSSVSLEKKSISHQELVSCNQNVFINPSRDSVVVITPEIKSGDLEFDSQPRPRIFHLLQWVSISVPEDL